MIYSDSSNPSMSRYYYRCLELLPCRVSWARPSAIHVVDPVPPTRIQLYLRLSLSVSTNFSLSVCHPSLSLFPLYLPNVPPTYSSSYHCLLPSFLHHWSNQQSLSSWIPGKPPHSHLLQPRHCSIMGMGTFIKIHFFCQMAMYVPCWEEILCTWTNIFITSTTSLNKSVSCLIASKMKLVVECILWWDWQRMGKLQKMYTAHYNSPCVHALVIYTPTVL